jgi:hypothetical protein
VRIVRRPAYNSRDEEHIAHEIAAWISARLQVNFDYVNEIEREPNGKFRAVKSRIDRFSTAKANEYAAGASISENG